MINSPQAVRFCNEKLRPACDRLVSAVRTLGELVAEYQSQSMGPLFAADQPTAASQVDDNAAADGRTVLVGADVDSAIVEANALLTYMTALKLAKFQKPAVNTAPLF